MPEAMTKPVEVTYFPITSPTDMLNALETAQTAIGYYGTVFVDKVGRWLLSLTGPTQPQVDFQLGTVAIWNGTSLASLSQTDFDAKYTPL